MKIQLPFLVQTLFCFFAFTSFAQNAENPCITPEQYTQIAQRCDDNIALLKMNGWQPEAAAQQVALNWPLKAAPGFNDCSFYAITAQVDQNNATGPIQDYNCGSNTYDGHKGTDIATYPFGFFKMDNNQVQVIAAAAGTIVDKADGNFDRNCATNNMQANYLVIQHSDGSRALYFHMKKNSLTTKAIGESVALGEYLGIVGSSGNSSGPHLHFEVWSGSTVSTRIDPFAGPCNTLNASSWWAVQKPYTEPAIIKASVNTTDIVIPACPATETPNESNCYLLPFQGAGLPAGYAKFYIFFRDETVGMTANMSILKPDGTTFSSWIYNSLNSYNASYRAYTKILPTIPGTYTFQATYNGITCSTPFDIMVASVTASGPTSFCQGGSVMLTAATAAAYAWSSGDTTQSITVSASGTYAVTLSGSSGCTAVPASVSVTVNPPPAAAVTAGGPTTFCQGGSVTLSAATASTYAWNTGASTQSIVISTAGNYTVTVTGANGCTATSAPTAITVNQLPTASISAGGPLTFCQGASVTLNATAASAYHWSTGATTQSIGVSNSGNYTVTVTGANGCTAVSAPATVTVNALPTATITADGPTTICAGSSVTLMASAANAYLWSNGATTQSINVSLPGLYTVTVTGANGCTAASLPITISIIQPPVITISAGGPTTFCQGNSVTLSVLPATAYQWSNGAGTQSIVVSASGNYTVTVTEPNGCTAVSMPIAVSVNPLPAVSVTPAGPTTFCQGGSVVLNASPANAYNWSTGATTQSISVSASGNYAVTITDGNGCTATSGSTAVNVNPLPVATVVPVGPTTFCQGGSIGLISGTASAYHWSNGATTQSITVFDPGNYAVTVTGANGCTAASTGINVNVNPLPTASIVPLSPTTFCLGGSVVLQTGIANAYNWSTGATTQSIPVENSGNYTVTVTDANGCTGASAPVIVTVNIPQSGLPIALNGDTLTSPYGQLDEWYLTGNPSPIDTGLTYQCTQAGNYYVIGIDANGCPATSSMLFVNCDASGTTGAAMLHQIKAYPNPVNDVLNLTGRGIENGVYGYAIVSPVGQVLLKDHFVVAYNRVQERISVAGLPDGLYLLVIEKGRDRMVFKVVIAHSPE